jgi:hypothetical protein
MDGFHFSLLIASFSGNRLARHEKQYQRGADRHDSCDYIESRRGFASQILKPADHRGADQSVNSYAGCLKVVDTRRALCQERQPL